MAPPNEEGPCHPLADELEQLAAGPSGLLELQQPQPSRGSAAEASRQVQLLLTATKSMLGDIKDVRSRQRAAQAISELEGRLVETATCCSRLHDRLAAQQARLELLRREEAWLLQRTLHLHSASPKLPRAPGFSGSSLACRNGGDGDGPLWSGAGGGGGAEIVSFSALPDPGAWDVHWEDKVLSLSVLDLVLLRRQWLQEMAMVLPKAKCWGPGSADYKQLVAACDRFHNFNQRAMTLIPEQWTLHTKYDLETLEPCELPSKQFIVDFLGRLENNEAIVAIFQESLDALRTLRSEYDALCAEHARLQQASAAAPSPQQPPAGADAAGCAAVGRVGAGPSDSIDCASLQALGTAADAEALDDLLRRMQGNLRRQHMVTKQCIFAVYDSRRERHATELVSSYLVLYPNPLDTIHYLELFS